MIVLSPRNVLVTLAAVLMAASGATWANAEDESHELQGVWQWILDEHGGELRDTTDRAIAIDGNKLLFGVGNQLQGDAKIAIDGKAKPKTIDIVINEDVALGIYRLKGETLQICLTKAGGPRPKSFQAADRDKAMWVLLRVEKKVRAGSGTSPVQGKVLLSDGTPFTAGQIEFVTVDLSLSSIGQIQENGTFQLSTYATNDGSPPGKYKVVVTDTSPAVSERYGRTETTPLEAEVKEGPNQFVFKLEPAK